MDTSFHPGDRSTEARDRGERKGRPRSVLSEFMDIANGCLRPLRTGILGYKVSGDRSKHE